MSHASFERLGHRPWALPSSPWVWRQSWLDLLFAHWPMDAALLQRLVPAPLKVQEFDGTSWVGLVPFRMAGVMRRPLPDLPWISAFPELNVRLYVEHEGKPGIWFLSLDAANQLAVWAARRYFSPALLSCADSRPNRRGHRSLHVAQEREGPLAPGELSANVGTVRERTWHSRALAHRTILPVRPVAGRSYLAKRRASRSLAAASCRSRNLAEHVPLESRSVSGRSTESSALCQKDRRGRVEGEPRCLARRCGG
jgi:uncharacterized protein YqjF (DUF2071 family)